MKKFGSSAIADYLKIISAYRTITESEIHEMYRTKDKESAVKEIVLRNLKFVFQLAIPWMRNAKKMGVLEDVIGAGTRALILATHKYNPLLSGYYKFVGRYIQSYFEMELYRFSNYSRVESKRLIKNGEGLNPNLSISQEIASSEEDNVLKIEDVIAHPGDNNICITMDVENLIERLRTDCNKIHELAAEIIQLRYAVGNRKHYPELSLSQTALRLGLSKEGVRKIEKKALAYLRRL
jgi:RNA polymerase sigma factor (sigma-70 family)